MTQPAPTAAEDAAARVSARHRDDPALLIEMLHDLQEEEGFISEAHQHVLAKRLNLGRAEVHGVTSFYHDFKAAPGGRVVVKLCRAEACQAQGANALIERILARRGLSFGETSPEGVAIEAAYCLGNCALGPAALVNGKPVGRLTQARLNQAIAEALS